MEELPRSTKSRVLLTFLCAGAIAGCEGVVWTDIANQTKDLGWGDGGWEDGGEPLDEDDGSEPFYDGGFGDAGTPPTGSTPGATCIGSCGTMAPTGCWCDSLCHQFGDCCADVASACEGADPDGGANDGGVNDGGVNDGGVNDGGVNDGGANDGGVNDGGVNDGGQGPTCASSCGGQGPGGCWCDAVCLAYGDCCPDKVEVCPNS